MIRKFAVPACAAAILGLSAPSAVAQSNDKASAVHLYDEAVRLTAAGKLADACVKYAESQRLDPQLGTLLHLGDCYEKSGQTASAWASFREATEVAGNRNDAREKVARKRAAALEPRVPKLVIEVPRSMQALGVRVERDGKGVGPGMWGVAAPTDPGAHVVSASAAGRAPWSENVTLAPSATVTVSVPELAPAASGETPASAALPIASASSGMSAATSNAPAPPADAGRSTGTGQRVVGFALIGAGAVGVAVGAVFGARMLKANSDAKNVCPSNVCTATDPAKDFALYKQLQDDARSARTISIVGFAAGGAAVVGGLVLVLTSGGGGDKQVSLAPTFERTGGGFALSGTW